MQDLKNGKKMTLHMFYKEGNFVRPQGETQ